MIFDKQVVLGLSIAYAASPFSRANANAVAFPHVAAETGDEKSPLDAIARKLRTTLTECGESFTAQKVVLTSDLNCGSRIGAQELCAVTLDGPKAEINCNDFTLSQVASSPYKNGQFQTGICLKNGATATNCNAQQFKIGIDVENGGQVVKSNLSSNYDGINAFFTADATVTIENT